MGNNNWKITCLHYGTLSCYKSLFDGGLDQVRYPFVYSGYLLQKDNRNILVDTGVHQDNIIDGKLGQTVLQRVATSMFWTHWHARA